MDIISTRTSSLMRRAAREAAIPVTIVARSGVPVNDQTWDSGLKVEQKQY